jgi:hypothetical protein
MTFDLAKWCTEEGRELSETTISVGIYQLCRDSNTRPTEAMLQIQDMLSAIKNAAVQAGFQAAREEAAERVVKVLGSHNSKPSN